MTKVLVTAEVEDSTKWEEGFRTHIDLFRKHTINNAVEFTTHEDNTIGICFEPQDLETWRAHVQSRETMAAMEYDGVKRDTVKFYVLDKKLKL